MRPQSGYPNSPFPTTEFERLRLAELERLTGCPIHRVIEGACREPGCQNAALELQKDMVMSTENCLLAREAASSDGGNLARTAPESPLPAGDAGPIFQIQPRLRCVL